MPQQPPLPPDVVGRLEQLDQHRPEHDLIHEHQLRALVALIRNKEAPVEHPQ